MPKGFGKRHKCIVMLTRSEFSMCGSVITSVSVLEVFLVMPSPKRHFILKEISK